MPEKCGLYIHFPFCEKKCRYCDFYSITDFKQKSQFINSLFDEIKLTLEHIPEKITVETIFFGGGTPSVFNVSDIEKLIDVLHKCFAIESSAEFTIECNPGTVDLEKLRNYLSLGINRLSIGVQSFNDDLLRFLGRIHDAEQAMMTIKDARRAGFENLSADLIFSIPGQTTELWEKDLAKITEFNIPHISCYNLSYEPGTPLYKDMLKKRIHPLGEDIEGELYLMTMDFLDSKNYFQYEISNFAFRGYECKHNLNYWQGVSYSGFGPSAHSFIKNKRSANFRSLNRYINSINKSRKPVEFTEELMESERRSEHIFLGLRSLGIDFNNFNKLFNLDLIEIITILFYDSINEYFIQQDGIISLTKQGKLVCDEICLKIISFIDNKMQ